MLQCYSHDLLESGEDFIKTQSLASRVIGKEKNAF